VRVLAVDPGLTRCGLAAVDGRAGRRVDLVAVDVVRTPASADLAARLLGIGEAVEGWLEQGALTSSRSSACSASTTSGR